MESMPPESFWNPATGYRPLGGTHKLGGMVCRHFVELLTPETVLPSPRKTCSGFHLRRLGRQQRREARGW